MRFSAAVVALPVGLVMAHHPHRLHNTVSVTQFVTRTSCAPEATDCPSKMPTSINNDLPEVTPTGPPEPDEYPEPTGPWQPEEPEPSDFPPLYTPTMPAASAPLNSSVPTSGGPPILPLPTGDGDEPDHPEPSDYPPYLVPTSVPALNPPAPTNTPALPTGPIGGGDTCPGFIVQAVTAVNYVTIPVPCSTSNPGAPPTLPTLAPPTNRTAIHTPSYNKTQPTPVITNAAASPGGSLFYAAAVVGLVTYMLV